MEIFFVTQIIDIETQNPIGAFSSAEKAVAYIRHAAGKVYMHKSGRMFTAKDGGALWAIDEYTIDALEVAQ